VFSIFAYNCSYCNKGYYTCYLLDVNLFLFVNYALRTQVALAAAVASKDIRRIATATAAAVIAANTYLMNER